MGSDYTKVCSDNDTDDDFGSFGTLRTVTEFTNGPTLSSPLNLSSVAPVAIRYGVDVHYIHTETLQSGGIVTTPYLCHRERKVQIVTPHYSSTNVTCTIVEDNRKPCATASPATTSRATTTTTRTGRNERVFLLCVGLIMMAA
jgi:hypothetical protein